MNTELCKKLKESGWDFSQKYDWKEFVIDGEFDSVGNLKIFRMPTLSELIDAVMEIKGACAFHLFSNEHILKWNSQWTQDGRIKQGEGSTPEEAVANLWLKLNEK